MNCSLSKIDSELRIEIAKEALERENVKIRFVHLFDI